MYLVRCAWLFVACLAVAPSASAQVWELASAPGFGSPLNDDFNLYVIGGDLYATAVNPNTGAEIFRYECGTIWEPLAGGTFGGDAETLLEHGGELFVSIDNPVTGVEVHRWDGTTWILDNVPGFDNNTFNAEAALYSTGQTLFAATENIVTGAEVWQRSGPTDWRQINTNGFGDSNNARVWWVEQLGTLFAVAENDFSGIEVHQHLGGSGWLQVNADGFGDQFNRECEDTPFEFNGELFVTVVRTNGCQVWRQDSIANWMPVTTDGFGNADNLAVESHGVFQGNLYFSTFNTVTGAEVHRYDGGMNTTLVSAPGFGLNTEGSKTLTEYGGLLWCGTENPLNGGEVWNWDGSPINSWAPPPFSPFPIPMNDSVDLIEFQGELFAYGSDFVYKLTAPDTFQRGDCNGDGLTNIADPITLLSSLFPSGPIVPVDCEDACDGNDDGMVDIADAITILTALFGTMTTPLPNPDQCCGPDPTLDSLTCVMSPMCP